MPRLELACARNQVMHAWNRRMHGRNQRVHAQNDWGACLDVLEACLELENRLLEPRLHILVSGAMYLEDLMLHAVFKKKRGTLLV